MRQIVSTEKAPRAIGPYSQAVRAGGWLFASGQIPIDPATGQMITGDIKTQTERVMKNLEAILEAAGLSFAHVVKTTVYLKDLNEFSAMNEIYGRFFPASPPARATVEVARLPRDARVEIDLLAAG
ncbi:MAG TPA: RidA family protein [Candidatus Acidoferrales bacterium]